MKRPSSAETANMPAAAVPRFAFGTPIPLSLLLVALTLIIYGQVYRFDFIVWDDPLYVTANDHIQTGFHWESIRWAFTANHAALWHPLTWLSHMLDFQLFGLSPAGHHLVNVFWHLANGLLLFRILLSMTREIWPSFLVAVLFVVHPFRAESVAWVTERKDVLSVFFWLLTTGFYLRYVRLSGVKSYVPVAVCLAMGLMVKPMLVTLPFALLLLDFWPLKRVRDHRSWIPLLREKIPLFVLILIAIVIAFWAHRTALALIPFAFKPLPLRLGNAVVAYFTYLYKSFWPIGLSAVYPFPDSLPLWKLGIASFVVAGCSWFAWIWRNRFPYVTIGWLWFLGTLVPALNIVQAGAISMADRFTYIPSLGLFFIVAWGLRDLVAWRPSFRKGVFLACTGAVIALCALSYVQVGYWKNSITLFQHALDVQEENALAHGCLGAAWIQQRDPVRAEQHLRRAVEINPDYPEALNDLGTICIEKGMYAEAVGLFSNALALVPRYAEAHNNLALALMRMGRFDEAIEHYQTALSIRPAFPKALNNLGSVLAQRGRLEDAKPYFQKALAIQPDFEEPYNNLGLLHYQQQDYVNARRYFEGALRLRADNPNTLFFLGLIAATQNREGEAQGYFLHALKLAPDFSEAQEQLRRLQQKN